MGGPEKVMEMALGILEQKMVELSGVEILVGGGGCRLDLVLARESFGGGTRREKYVEVRNVNSETIDFHCEERPAMFLAVDGLLKNGVYMNGKLVGEDGDFETLLEAALARPWLRIIEPPVPNVGVKLE